MAKAGKKSELGEHEPQTTRTRGSFIKPAGFIATMLGLMTSCFFAGYGVGKDQRHERPPELRPVLHPGIYEMQWAGENWLGVLNVNDDGRVRLLMNRVAKAEGRIIQDDPMFDAEGTLQLDENGDFKLAILVTKTYENSGETENFERLIATLKPYHAYAGPVDYHNRDLPNAESGHFIMVNYRQVGVGRQPKDWGF